ncbi:MAG: hypothetical protein FJ096_11235 [Deltaproteobacteria bacterium]|nr:hypothetical protein [Deltaproteobacteria bacterium]
MLTARDIASWPRAELERLLANGHPVSPQELAGHAFFGVSLGLPRLIERATWKTFAKVFLANGDGSVHGMNVRLEQRGVDGPLEPRRQGDGRPVTFGPFAVRVDAHRVVLDYGAFAPAWHPLARLRDPLVAVNSGSCELLLGTTRLALPWGEAQTPSYFTLERRAPWPPA